MGAVSLIRTGDYTAFPEPEPDPLSAGSISASAGDGEVAISEGTAPSGGSGAYTRQLYRSTSGGSKGSAISGATSLPYTDEGLTNDTEYFYTLEVGDGVDTDDTAQVSATPVEPSESHPNEPVGMTTLLNRGYNSIDETDAAGAVWADNDGGPGTFEAYQTLAIESHGDAPESPSNVGAVILPAGHGGSSSSATVRSRASFASANSLGDQIYLEWWWKCSDNWYGHEGGQNKIFYLGSPIVIEYGYESGRGGSGNDPYFNWTIALQGGEITNLRVNHPANQVSPTLEQAQILRDTWYHNELLVTCNTPGTPNGSIELWQNGVKLMQFVDRNILGAGDYAFINFLQWHPIYGGGNTNEVPADQYQYMDHIYLSGTKWQ